jgi:UbiD family decarboxylase
MAHADLRGWLKAVESRGELLRLSGASYDLEMAGIAEILARESKKPPATLFDDIPGFPKGYRALFGMLGSPWRLAMTLGLPEKELNYVSLVRNWRKKRRELKLMPPKVAHPPVS